MDHRLAIVIVPKNSSNPVRTSRELLDRFQRPPVGEMSGDFEAKFRYKRVGGWFDGLVIGRVGQQQWSTVLRMLLDGTATSAATPFPGFGPETITEIERRIAADNTIDLDHIWPLAPCSIIVTPAGEWIAHAAPDQLDDAGCEDEACESWDRMKRALFWEHRGAIAVAWDLSWHFIGAPAVDPHRLKTPKNRMWGSRDAANSQRTESGTNRVATARLAASRKAADGKKDTREDEDALDRWTGEGGGHSGTRTLRLLRKATPLTTSTNFLP